MAENYANNVELGIGQIIPMGRTINRGTEQFLMWRVLAVQNGKMLVVSENVLTQMPAYKKAQTDKVWKETYYARYVYKWSDCDIRSYLNGEFLTEYGLADSNIFPVSHLTEGNAFTPDEITEDKVFLLSEEEVQKYFKTDESRMAVDLKGTPVRWELRTPSRNSACSSEVVYRTGAVVQSGMVVSEKVGIRPAFWLNI